MWLHTRLIPEGTLEIKSDEMASKNIYFWNHFNKKELKVYSPTNAIKIHPLIMCQQLSTMNTSI